MRNASLASVKIQQTYRGCLIVSYFYSQYYRASRPISEKYNNVKLLNTSSFDNE